MEKCVIFYKVTYTTLVCITLLVDVLKINAKPLGKVIGRWFQSIWGHHRFRVRFRGCFVDRCTIHRMLAGFLYSVSPCKQPNDEYFPLWSECCDQCVKPFSCCQSGFWPIVSTLACGWWNVSLRFRGNGFKITLLLKKRFARDWHVTCMFCSAWKKQLSFPTNSEWIDEFSRRNDMLNR